MTYLAAMLMSLVTGLTAYFAQFMVKRVAVVAAVVTSFVLIVTTFTSAINNALGQIGSLFPPAIMSSFIGLMPSNLPFCLGLLMTAHIAAVLYRWKAYLLQMASLKAGTGGL